MVPTRAIVKRCISVLGESQADASATSSGTKQNVVTRTAKEAPFAKRTKTDSVAKARKTQKQSAKTQQKVGRTEKTQQKADKAEKAEKTQQKAEKTEKTQQKAEKAEKTQQKAKKSEKTQQKSDKTQEKADKAEKTQQKAKRKHSKETEGDPGNATEADLQCVKKVKSEQQQQSQATPELPMSGAATRGFLLLGAHVSAAGGLHRAFANARAIGAGSLALFVRNQRRWDSKPLTDPEAEAFRSTMAASGLPPEAVLPHGSYLINCASPDPVVRRRSEAALIDELDRCRRLGIGQYNLHPGSAGAANPDRPAAIARLAESLAAALAAVPSVRLLLENSAGQGGCLGGRFAELGDILAATAAATAGGAADDRLGVCLDTCHAFAFGYDLRTADGQDAALAELDAALTRGGVGGIAGGLRALHLNDSRGSLGSRVDRHADIGAGQIGADALGRLLRRPELRDGRRFPTPAVLETPGVETYAEQLRALRRLAEY